MNSQESAVLSSETPPTILPTPAWGGVTDGKGLQDQDCCVITEIQPFCNHSLSILLDFNLIFFFFNIRFSLFEAHPPGCLYTSLYHFNPLYLLSTFIGFRHSRNEKDLAVQ